MADSLPAARWFATLPTSYLAASGLITDTGGRVLLVEPNYREHWTMPGGVVEDGEAPHLACEREVAEEVGLSVTAGRLLAVQWSAPRGQRPKAFTSFVFDCGTVEAGTPITVQESELDGYVFAEPGEAVRLMHPDLAPRLEAALRARQTGSTLYVPS